MNPNPHLASLIDLALSEDLGSGDLTTDALFAKEALGEARVVAKQELVVSGTEVAAAVFSRLNASCKFNTIRHNGKIVKQGTVIARVNGPLRCLLVGERTALNFLQRLCGIASLTRRYTMLLKDTKCLLLDTRKTTPGYRVLEKSAVRDGGGHNHRMGLFDGVMLKDNHIATAGSIVTAVAQTRKRIPPTVKIEVETSNLKQVRLALKAGADIIMLDNMSLKNMTHAVRLIDGRARTEASGLVNLDNILAVVQTGVDYVSVGAITHSAPSVDISMEIQQV